MSKSYEFDDLLEGQHGGGDEIDEMVRRNIEDAVKAAELGSGGAGTSFLDEHGGSYLGEEEAGFKARGQRPASGASSAGRRGSSAGAGAGGPGSGVASCLDVPGHADATVRLHKARIRGLEDEVEKLGSALSERDRQLAAAKKDVKAVKAEQATWAKTQKGLEAQIEKLKKAAVDEREAALAREAAIKEQAREGSRTDKLLSHPGGVFP
ncbi:hypothetical protein FOA52_014900 [Chlamydomonas sp. UWO 241]|nr:hypothetical protein FOA52_014900 [Chlamydomonas sp. UWO 241]